MSLQSQSEIDDIDWLILAELQADARLSYSEIGRRVSLSQPTVTERVRRLEEAGVIRGYHADLDPVLLGRPIIAFIRLKTEHPAGRLYKLEAQFESDFDEISECHRVSGDDCVLIKAQVASIVALNDLLGRLNRYGAPNTAIVLSTSLERHSAYVISGDKR